MSVANPASYYVTGNDKKQFTFTPGNKLFQVQVYGSRGWIPVNVMLMADDDAHVRKILKDLVDFRIACGVEYQAHNAEYRKKFPGHDHEIDHTRNVMLTNHIGQWLMGNSDGLPEGFSVTITEINPNQLFKVSWASNDYILG